MLKVLELLRNRLAIAEHSNRLVVRSHIRIPNNFLDFLVVLDRLLGLHEASLRVHRLFFNLNLFFLDFIVHELCILHLFIQNVFGTK